MRLRQRIHLTVAKDLLRFAQVFSQVLHVGLELPFDVIEEVLSSTIIELERNQIKLANPGPKDDPEVIAVIDLFYLLSFYISLFLKPF